MLRVAVVCALVSIVGCSSSKAGPGSADGGAEAAPSSLVAARPYHFAIPDAYDPSKPTPLVVMLHGYGASAQLEEVLMGIVPIANEHNFLYAYPDGTKNAKGSLFWNATDACCDFDHTGVDDVAYIDAVIDDMAAQYNVDKKRVYVIGHSNGGFMANRYACDRASRVAGIVSLAGAQFEDPSRCTPSEPVAMLQVHGDNDQTVLYDGGVNEDTDGTQHPYPSAHVTVATWAAKDGCSGTLTATGRTLDIDLSVTGAETVEETYGPCSGGANVTLWTMKQAGHVPGLGPSWGESIWAFLSAHAKP
jgi:polyhydroxybutyrate depolymerase